MASYYDRAGWGGVCHYIVEGSRVATEEYLEPIDFWKTCSSANTEGCKLHPALTRGDSYGAIWTGQLLVRSGGRYTFYFQVVDDQARLTIGGEVVIDHWCSAQTSGSVVLDAGAHPITIEYYQGPPARAALRVDWEGPGFSREVIPAVATPLPDGFCNSPAVSCSQNPSCSGAAYWVGGAINALDGNHAYQVTDMSVPVVGGELAFERTYSSQDAAHADYAGALGYGWTHNYDMKLDFPGEGYVVVHSQDGSRLRFFDLGNGAYVPYPGVQGGLVGIGSTWPYTYTLTGSDQAVYTFDWHGDLVSIEDPQGHKTTLIQEYLGEPCSSRLLKVVGPDANPTQDRYLEFSYDDTSCRIQAVRDHTGRGVSFGYDQNGDLVAVTDTRGLVWTYTYTGNHLLDEVADPNGQRVEKTGYEGEQAVVQWVGDQVTPTLQLEFFGESTWVVDGRGIGHTVYYDDRHTWTGTQDILGHRTERSYDTRFNLHYNEDANGNPTEIEWSDCGCRPEQVTDALQNAAQMAYDGRNNLTRYTDARNDTTRYEYALGTSLLISVTDALLQTTHYTYSDGVDPAGVPAGLLLEMEDPLGHHTHYFYDGFGQITAAVALNGGERLTTTYAYDSLGRLISTTAAAGTPLARTALTYYDAAGHTLRTVENCTAGSYEACRTVEPDPLQPDRNLVTGYGYDKVGNQAHVTDTLGIVTFYQYDAANRLIRVVENYKAGKGQNEENLYNITTRYGYDANGNQAVVTDTLGMVTRTFYDELNRPKRVVANYVGDGRYNPDYPDRNVTTQYEYDAAGNQVEVIDAVGAGTSTDYDALNRPVAVTRNYAPSYLNGAGQGSAGTGPITTRYGYDAVGNQVLVADPLGVKTVTAYDAADRAVATTQNYDPRITAPTTYVDNDPGGLPAYYEWIEPYQVITYSLGPGSQQVSIPLPPGTAFQYYGAAYTSIWATRYGYLYFGEEATATLGYSAAGRPSFPAPGLPNNVVAPLWSDSYDDYTLTVRAGSAVDPLSGDDLFVVEFVNLFSPPYWGVPQRFEVVLNMNRDSILFQYRSFIYGDPHGVGIENADGTQGVAYFHGSWEPPENRPHSSLAVLFTEPPSAEGNVTSYYGYDAAGNQVAVTNALGMVTVREYDGLGRLLAETVNYTTTVGTDPNSYNLRSTYGYDVAGNQVTVTSALGVRTVTRYDVLGRPYRVIQNFQDGLYDPNHPDQDVFTDYRYDLAGRHTEVVLLGQYTTTTVYDVLGRVREVVDPLGHTTSQTYDALGRTLSSSDANGNATAYGYDALGRTLVITDPLTHATRTSYDGPGRRLTATDAEGVVTLYTYDALGRLVAVTENYRPGVPADEQTNVRTAYTYDALGNLLEVENARGYSTAYSYDRLSRLRSEADPLLHAWSYAYRCMGLSSPTFSALLGLP